ncbi:MAG: L-tyrosine/L-tryptophan isonitrile synthase family protein [Pseudonocardiaceae bacterium]
MSADPTVLPVQLPTAAERPGVTAAERPGVTAALRTDGSTGIGGPRNSKGGPVPGSRGECDPLSVSSARSLGGVPLAELGAVAGVSRLRLHLDTAETGTLIGALLASADTASARLAEATRQHFGRRADDWSPQSPADLAAALHRMLTRSRFLKGSRSCYPLQTATAEIVPFIEQHRPVTIMVTGFPFKEHDNGLKAPGAHPDLAELGALVRLRELHRAFSELYPPGLRIVVLADGGYARPRAWSEVQRYRRRVRRYAQLVGLDPTVEFCDQNRYVAGLLGEHGWGERERIRTRVRELIEIMAGPPRTVAEAGRADRRMVTTFGPELLTGVPSFRDLVSSLVYSVPVPAPRGADPLRWGCTVLAAPDRVEDPALPGELVRARRAVLSSAWLDAVNHLAAAVADNAVGVPGRHPLHVRLATVVSRQGCSGFSYLGGSTLLPWHGTGCLDGRGRVCADFLISLLNRGFQPVYSPALSPATDPGEEPGGGDQPLLMVPFARTVFSEGRRRVDPELLASARLRSR